jgi:hypothetical protein
MAKKEEEMLFPDINELKQENYSPSVWASIQDQKEKGSQFVFSRMDERLQADYKLYETDFTAWKQKFGRVTP